MTKPTSLTLTPIQFRDLIAPVLPLASKDDMLRVLNAVLIRTDGRWLTATATDRFRVGIQRIEKHATDDDPTTVWPEFQALIPLHSVKSMLATFKPARRSAPFHEMKMTVREDRLIVAASGAFDLFDSAQMEWRILLEEFPKVESLFRQALETPDADRSPVAGVNPDFLRDFSAASGGVLRIEFGAVGKGMVVTDDHGFIAFLMPRRSEGGEREDWSGLLAENPEPKKAAPKKRAAKKAAAPKKAAAVPA